MFFPLLHLNVVLGVCNKSLSSPLGSPYYDNVRPLCYSDSDAVLLCFDISRPDTFDCGLKKVMAPISHFIFLSLSFLSLFSL